MLAVLLIAIAVAVLLACFQSSFAAGLSPVDASDLRAQRVPRLGNIDGIHVEAAASAPVFSGSSPYWYKITVTPEALTAMKTILRNSTCKPVPGSVNESREIPPQTTDVPRYGPTPPWWHPELLPDAHAIELRYRDFLVTFDCYIWSEKLSEVYIYHSGH